MDTIHDEGWVKLYRKSIDSQVFQNDGLWKVWTWCLLKANHEDKWVSIKTGKGTSEVFIKRGQFIFGRKTAAKELKMVERTVHKRMLKLETMRNCDIQSDTHYSIVTILNYELYQGSEKDEVTGKVTGKGQASDTNKNDKNEKNNNIGRPPKKETDPRVKEFLKYWGETFLQETGSPYTASFGKDGRLIKDLLKIHPLETLKELTRNFFKDRNVREQVQQGRIGYTIGIFFKEVNRLVSLKGMNPLELAKREISRKNSAEAGGHERSGSPEHFHE